jgi:hypothetical protein
VDQVFVDGRMMTLARHPNRGENPYEPKTVEGMVKGAQVSVSNIAGTAVDALKGASIWAINGYGCAWGSARIIAQTNDLLTVDSTPPLLGNGKASAYLEGAMAALDTQGRMVPTQRRIYLMSPDGSSPATLKIEATRRRWAFDL